MHLHLSELSCFPRFGNAGWKMSLLKVLTLLALISSVQLPAIAAGPVVQLLWATQPGSATVGNPFGQQPVLITADATGAPSTVGLADTVNVTVDSEPAGHLNGGPITVNLGTSGLNGVATFSDLQINTAGGYSIVATTGNGTNGVFSPTNDLPACKLWLDASDLSTLTLNASNNLYFWRDKSGIANNATNINGADLNANVPRTNANFNLAVSAYGGQRTVSFYGTNRLNINLTGITNSTYSIVALTILDPAVTANNDYYIGTPFTGDGVDKVLHIGYRNTTQYTFAQYADDLNVPTAGAGPLIASHIHSPGQKQVYFNGIPGGTQNGANHLVTVGQGTIGQGNGGNFRGDIAEIVVYSTNLTDLQRVALENYLNNKWLGQFSAAATSVPFFVGNGESVAGLRFSEQPSDTIAGNNILPAVGVLVTNSSGAGVANIPVALTLASGTGPMNGTLMQPTDANGIATFADLNFSVTGPKSLRATVSGAATNISSGFNILPAAASQLVIRTQPSANATAGIALSQQPVVSIEDSFGNIVSNAVDEIVISQTDGGNLSETPDNAVHVAAVNGTATFSGLYITNAGTTTLTVSSGTFPTLNSGNITVVAGAPSMIAVQQQPSATAQVGVPFESQPSVIVTDAYGNPVVDNTIVSVSTTDGAAQGPATSVGTTSGVATFVGLSVTNTGMIRLVFTSGLASAESSDINVAVGPAMSVSWTTQPGAVLAGVPFGQQPVLKTVDAGGNVTTEGLSPTNLVVVHLVSGTGLVGDRRIFNIGTDGFNGIINFEDLQIDASASGSGYVLAADYIGSEINPTNISGSILWLDSYDRSTLQIQDTDVTTWIDKSGFGNNATNSGNFPKTNLNTSISQFSYGGQETVDFFGTNWLNVDLTPLSGFEGFTIFVVDVVREIPSATYFLGTSFNNVDATLHFGYRSANQFTLAQYADDLNWTAPTNFASATPRLWTLRLDSGASQTIFLNGLQRATRGATGAPDNLLQGFVGQASGGSYRGDLAEVIVYERGLDDTERMAVEKYLTHKWLSHSRALTDPFAVSSATPSLAISHNGSGVKLTVSGASGKTYRILATDDLTKPISLWMPVGTNILDGTGLWEINDASTQGARFYRAVTP